MPLAQSAFRDDAQFVFPERVFGPVREIRRNVGGAWEDGMEYDMPVRGVPAYRGGYYEYDEMDFAGPPRPPMRRTPPPMGMGYQRNFHNAYFKPGPIVEETSMRTYRSTPPPPSLLDDMARFRASTPPLPVPMGPGPMMGGTAVSRRSFGRVSPVPHFAAAGGATVMSQQAFMGGEVISETVTEGRTVGYDVWEEEIVRPIVAPVVETVMKQEPMLVEKRITQETVAPIVMQEMGAAAATTVVEAAPMAAATVIQEMGASAPPTILSEYGVAEAPTFVQEMGAAVAPTIIQEGYAPAVAVTSTMVMPEPVLTSQWETRPATVIREADTSLPPVMSGTMSQRSIVVNEMEPSPIVVPDESPIFVNEQVPVATPFGIGSFQGGQQPFGPNMGNGMNNMGMNGFNNNMGGPLPSNNSGPFPSSANNMNMGPMPFGGTNDLNNVASSDRKQRHGLKKLTAKFHRHNKH